MKVLNSINKYALAGVLLASSSLTLQNVARCEELRSVSNVEINNSLKKDGFVSSFELPPADGSTNPNTLAFAPNPDVTISGVKHKAVIVVDLSKNVLYKYDKQGNPEKAYLIASGKKSTPTHVGVRIVTHIETYPYKGAPARSKRRRSPRDYGPKIICLNVIDPKTGEQSSIGEFIHGNNNRSSIGKYASHGCMRMDNEVIKQLSQEVKRGDIVVIRR